MVPLDDDRSQALSLVSNHGIRLEPVDFLKVLDNESLNCSAGTVLVWPRCAGGIAGSHIGNCAKIPVAVDVVRRFERVAMLMMLRVSMITARAPMDRAGVSKKRSYASLAVWWVLLFICCVPS